MRKLKIFLLLVTLVMILFFFLCEVLFIRTCLIRSQIIKIQEKDKIESGFYKSNEDNLLPLGGPSIENYMARYFPRAKKCYLDIVD